MPITAGDIGLGAGRRGVALAAPEEDESLLLQGLDLLGRPVSGVMGLLTGLADPTIGGALEGGRQGLMGERNFGFSDLAAAQGVDTSGTGTRYALMAADVLNPLDPLNYVGAGFTKAGKLARGIHGGTKALDAAQVATRTAAAEAGAWGALTFFGKTVTPKPLNVLLAKGVDKGVERVTRSKTWETVMDKIGGVRRLEQKNPALRAFGEMIRGKRDAKTVDERTFVEAVGLVGQRAFAEARKRGLDEDAANVEADALLRQVWPLLETPAMAVARLRDEALEIEGKLAAADGSAWRPAQFLRPEEVKEFERAAARDAAGRKRRIAALENLDKSKVQETVYHGSLHNFDEVKTSPEEMGHARTARLGAFFSEDKNVSRHFGGGGLARWQRSTKPLESGWMYEARINLQNPLDLDNLTAQQVADLDAAFPDLIYAREKKGDNFKLLQAIANRTDAPETMSFEPWLVKNKGFSAAEAAQENLRARGVDNSTPLSDEWMKWLDDIKERQDSALPVGQRILKEMGYDGIIVNTEMDSKWGPRKQYVVFDPENVVFTGKSTTADHMRFGRAKPLRTEDELRILKTMQVDPADLPPRESLVAARALTLGRLEKGLKNHFEAPLPVIEAAELLGPLAAKARGLIEGVGARYEKGYRLPIEDYMKHMFPTQWSALEKRSALKARETALAAEFAGKGYEGPELARAVREALGRDKFVPEEARGEIVSGRGPWRKQRQLEGTVEEINEAFLRGESKVKFEDNAAIGVDAMYRDANRFVFAHDIHAEVLKNKDFYRRGAEVLAMPRSEAKNWVKTGFSVPFLKDGTKDPFRDMFVRKDVAEVMQSHMGAVNFFTSEGGLDGIITALHGVRRWWTSWTLAPFPSFHARNLGTDMIFAHQGGLNPVTDLSVAALEGRSNYMASMEFMTGERRIPLAAGAKFGPGGGGGQLQSFLDEVSQAQGKPFTREDLEALLRKEGLVGSEAMRDLDFEGLLDESPDVVRARAQRSKLSKAADYLPLQAPGRSPWIKKGFAAGQKVQELPRVALWMSAVREALPVAKSAEDAFEHGFFKTRKHMYDYGDLTETERKYLKLLMPFYTFTRKNLPQQLETAFTDPGRNQWAVRLYNSAWGEKDDRENIQPEDLPQWLEESLGMPLRKTEEEDGSVSWEVFSPRGWLPQTEINEVAELFRKDDFGRSIAARMNPVFKELWEQALNRDAFTGREIASGKVVDVMGVPVHPRAAHLVRNIRLISEADRLNPGDIFTKIGQWMGWWEEGRPHRREAKGMERAMRTFLGTNIYTVNPKQEQTSEAARLEMELRKAEGLGKLAGRKGQTLEQEQYGAEAEKLVGQLRGVRSRLEEIRGHEAARKARRWRLSE